MEQQYTFKTKSPDELNKRKLDNPNVFIHYEVGVNNVVTVTPNNEYKLQEMAKLTNFMDNVQKLLFLFNTQKIIQKFILILQNHKNKVNDLYSKQSSTIEEQIQDKKDFIEANKRELDDFLQDQNSAITRKEYDQQLLEFFLMIGDEKTTQAKQQLERVKAIQLKKFDTELRMNDVNERRNLDLLYDLKRKLNQELTNKIKETNQTYNKTVQDHQTVMKFLEESRQYLVVSYGTDQLNQIKNQIIRYQQNNIQLFQTLGDCFNSYTFIFEQIQVELKKIENNQKITEYTIKFEVARIEKPMQEIQIKYYEEKIKQNEDRLPACEALDSIPALQHSVQVIYNNFKHIDNNKPRLGFLDSSEVVVPKYEFRKANEYNIVPSEATLALKRKIGRLDHQMRNLIYKLGDEDRAVAMLRQLNVRPQQIDKEARANYDKDVLSISNQLKQITKLIQLFEQDLGNFKFSPQNIKAFVGCLAQFMCIKKNVCLMCCRCCYSKDLHNYTDIYRKDYERIIIKHYKQNNHTQRNLSIHQVESFKVAHLPQLLLDLEFVGAYRSDHGAKQKIEFDFRFNDIAKSLTYTGFEIANLLVLQEMSLLGYDVRNQLKMYEDKDQAIEMGELSVGILEQHITSLA